MKRLLSSRLIFLYTFSIYARELVKRKEALKRIQEKEIRAGYSRLTKLLISRKLTISTMESATSGQIASLITDTEGASAIFKGAYITYSNEAKIQEGVSSEIIQKHSVYSKETAEAMAKACKESYSADIGIGVTGTMGNIDPVNPKTSVPGQVYFAISTKDGTYSWFKELAPEPSRLAYKLTVAGLVLNKITEILNS